MEETISRREHDEFARRIDAENHRQNNRIAKLEEGISETHELTVTVGKLATNMESMLKEMERQGKRLSALEERDGEMWRKVVGYVITAVIGLILGAAFTNLGI